MTLDQRVLDELRENGVTGLVINGGHATVRLGTAAPEPEEDYSYLVPDHEQGGYVRNPRKSRGDDYFVTMLGPRMGKRITADEKTRIARMEKDGDRVAALRDYAIGYAKSHMPADVFAQAQASVRSDWDGAAVKYALSHLNHLPGISMPQADRSRVLNLLDSSSKLGGNNHNSGYQVQQEVRAAQARRAFEANPEGPMGQVRVVGPAPLIPPGELPAKYQ